MRPQCVHITRRRGVYYYRRRLPAPLAGEVSISLGTKRFREAEYLAGVLDRLFLRQVRAMLASPDVLKVVREYLRDALEIERAHFLATPPGKPLYALHVPPGEDPAEADLEIVSCLLSDALEARMRRDPRPVAELADRLMAAHNLPPEARPELVHGLLQAQVQVLEEARRLVVGDLPRISLADEPPAPISSASSAPAPAPSSPLLSSCLEEFFGHAADTLGWRGQTKKQAEATFRMFIEICGDRPVQSYTKRDAGDFHEVLRRLPALYAKRPQWRSLPLREIAEQAKHTDEPRLAGKTIKRHFSALGPLFEYLIARGLYQGVNPAHGQRFPRRGKDKGERPRVPWTTERLIALFTSPVWTGCHPRFRARRGEHIIRDAYFWLPLLGLYHGNRLEEFAQLRRGDVKQADGVWYFDITDEGERQLKNPQSRRRVPLHPQLLEWGFLQYLGDPAERPDELVFPELRPGGPDKKLGFYVTKWFARYRKQVEGAYDERMDYHSFRHGVTTKLISAGVGREIVDYLIGHEGAGTTQVVYHHGRLTPLPVLRDAIAKVRFPEVEAVLGHLRVSV